VRSRVSVYQLPKISADLVGGRQLVRGVGCPAFGILLKKEKRKEEWKEKEHRIEKLSFLSFL
jgi:hypothetical protein